MEPTGQPEPKHDIVDVTLSAVRSDFFVVGTNHVAPWYAWLAIGSVAGIVVVLALAANRDGEIAPANAEERKPAKAEQAGGLAALRQTTSPFGYQNAKAKRTAKAAASTYDGGVIRTVTASQLRIDATVYDPAASAWGTKKVTITNSAIKKIEFLELSPSGAVERRAGKRAELKPGMKINIVRVGKKFELTVLPAEVGTTQ